MAKELLCVKEINPAVVFTGNGIDKVLHDIEQEVLSFVPDLSTEKSRKEIASLARKVASSKVVLDGAGKQLVSDWKAKSKLVDESRKEARDFLDGLRDRVRKPLTDWEEDKKRKEIERFIIDNIYNNGVISLDNSSLEEFFKTFKSLQLLYVTDSNYQQKSPSFARVSKDISRIGTNRSSLFNTKKR